MEAAASSLERNANVYCSILIGYTRMRYGLDETIAGLWASLTSPNWFAWKKFRKNNVLSVCVRYNVTRCPTEYKRKSNIFILYSFYIIQWIILISQYPTDTESHFDFQIGIPGISSVFCLNYLECCFDLKFIEIRCLWLAFQKHMLSKHCLPSSANYKRFFDSSKTIDDIFSFLFVW